MTVQDVEGCSTKSPSILPIAVVIDCDQRSLSAISTSGHRSLASRSNRFLWDEQRSFAHSVSRLHARAKPSCSKAGNLCPKTG